MKRNLSGSTLEQQKVDLIDRTDAFGLKKSKTTIGMNHSGPTLDNRNSIFNQLVVFLDNFNFDQKLNKMPSHLFSELLQTKVEKGNCSTSIERDISLVSASFKANKRKRYYTLMTEKDFDDLKTEFKYQGKKSKHNNRAFTNPNNIINSLYEKRIASGILSELQNTCGYRIDEAFQVKPEYIESIGNKFFIRKNVIKGKGGFPCHLKEISAELYSNIKIMYEMDNGWGISQDTYNNDIKYVAGNEHSSHAFRYNYAQSLYKKLLQEGYTENEAKLEVSEQMCHHRASIVNHYLFFKI